MCIYKYIYIYIYIHIYTYMYIIVYTQMYICHSCAVVETWRSIPVTSYGSEERQVSADGNPRWEIITSLDVLIKLIGLKKYGLGT